MLFEKMVEKESNGVIVKVKSVSYVGKGLVTEKEIGSEAIDFIKHKAEFLASSIANNVNYKKQQILYHLKEEIKLSVKDQNCNLKLFDLINELEKELSKVVFIET